jgi:hypothetical protein
MNRSPWLVLALLALLAGCRADSTGADTRRYACGQDDDCATGFVCLASVCQRPVTPPLPEAGEDSGTPADGGPDTDAGVPDAGVPDAGAPDAGAPDAGMPDDAGSPGSGDGGTDGGSGPVPTRLGFVTTAQTVTAGQCSRAATVETQTAAGSTAAVGSAVTVTLGAATGSGVTFYQDATCSSATSTTTVAAGASRATFYFRGTTAQGVTVTASAPGFTSAQQGQTVLAAAPASLVFTTSAQTLAVGECSSKVELESRDAYANPTSFSVQTNLTPSGTDLFFYSDATCNTAITNAPFAAGASRTSFYFRSRPSGTVRLTASVPGLNPVSQDQDIRALQSTVRTGYCEMGPSETTKNCFISPAVSDRTKTLLLVQAVGPGLYPSEASARCWLATRSTITCSRNSAPGNGQTFPIWWKTVEMASGLRVQHLQPTCSSSALTVPVTINSVSPGNTFLLVSSEIDGTTLDADDFFTAQLANSSRVDLQFSTPCSPAWKGSLQVVEMSGARVTRGTASMSSGTTQASASGLSAVDLNTSALLFTHRVSTPSTARLCDRVLRGELSSSTSINFSRGAGSFGCSAATVDEIGWERIDFGPLARVQTKLIEFPANSRSPSSPPSITSVDTTRTVVFSSAQSLGGQAGGESNYNSPVISESLAALYFNSSTELVAQRIANNANSYTKMNACVVQFEP